MINIKAVVIMIVVTSVLLYLNRFGLFKNPLIGTLVLVLILLSVPITWKIKEYIKKKNSKAVFYTRCRFCDAKISEEANYCRNCGKGVDDDEFTEDLKEKKICPYCGLKELETIYEISRGYKEVCASCGKSRVSRKALKMTFTVIACLFLIPLLFYCLSQINLK